MKTRTTDLQRFLHQEFKDQNQIWLTSTYTLRKTIGILGMALPLVLFLLLYFSNHLLHPLESISHYYYTRVSGIFVAVLTMLALFLIIYRGPARIDLIISCIAGMGALIVAFFPTSNLSDICCDISKPYVVTMLPQSKFRVGMHYFAAALFLGSLAYMSVFLFTKSNKTPETCGKRKILRNRIYRSCGIMMIIALLIILLGGLFKLIPEDFYTQHHLTFWMETLAIESFGFSWLIKGEAWLKDIDEAQTEEEKNNRSIC